MALGGVAVAAPSSSSTITACKLKSTGAVRILDSGNSCKRTELKVTWNQKGQTGATGLPGVAGPAGANGVDGKKGDTGPQGPQGWSGGTGAQGPAGPKGDQGSAGTNAPEMRAGECSHVLTSEEIHSKGFSFDCNYTVPFTDPGGRLMVVLSPRFEDSYASGRALIPFKEYMWQTDPFTRDDNNGFTVAIGLLRHIPEPPAGIDLVVELTYVSTGRTGG